MKQHLWGTMRLKLSWHSAQCVLNFFRYTEQEQATLYRNYLQVQSVGRHLLQTVSTTYFYRVLVRAKPNVRTNEISDISQAIFRSTSGTDAKQPAWCAAFCTKHAHDIVDVGEWVAFV